MSLAPGERRTLAHIEDSLCRSDPRLATCLTTFRLPAWLRLTVSCKRLVMRITGSGRPARRRLTRPAVMIVGAALLGLIVAGGFALRNARPPLCMGHGVRDGVIDRVLTCRPRGSGVAGKPPRPGNSGRPGAAMTARQVGSTGRSQAGNPAGRQMPPPGSGGDHPRPAHG